MFRITVASIVVLFLAGIATAAIEPGDNLITFNAGYATGKAAVSGTTLDGPGVSFVYENMAQNKPVSFFWSIAWSEISKDETSGSNTLTRQIETWPMYFGGKTYLGQGAFQGHAGLALGVYFSTVETAVAQTGTEYAKWSAAGWGMGVPLGATLSLGDSVFINGEYFLNWMWTNAAFDNDILHSFHLGLGFRLGK